MEKKSKLFFAIFGAALILSTFLTFHRTMVLRNYPIVESEPVEEPDKEIDINQ